MISSAQISCQAITEEHACHSMRGASLFIGNQQYTIRNIPLLLYHTIDTPAPFHELLAQRMATHQYHPCQSRHLLPLPCTRYISKTSSMIPFYYIRNIREGRAGCRCSFTDSLSCCSTLDQKFSPFTVPAARRPAILEITRR